MSTGSNASKRLARGVRVWCRRERMMARQASAKDLVSNKKGISTGCMEVFRLRSKWPRTMWYS